MTSIPSKKTSRILLILTTEQSDSVLTSGIARKDHERPLVLSPGVCMTAQRLCLVIAALYPLSFKGEPPKEKEGGCKAAAGSTLSSAENPKVIALHCKPCKAVTSGFSPEEILAASCPHSFFCGGFSLIKAFSKGSIHRKKVTKLHGPILQREARSEIK